MSQPAQQIRFCTSRDGTRIAYAAGGAGPPQKVFGGLRGYWEGNRTGFAVFDNGQRFLVSVLVPVTAPQVITIGHNWMAGLPRQR